MQSSLIFPLWFIFYNFRSRTWALKLMFFLKKLFSCNFQRFPADKAYFIAKEVSTTERTYLKDLEVITSVCLFLHWAQSSSWSWIPPFLSSVFVHLLQWIYLLTWSWEQQQAKLCGKRGISIRRQKKKCVWERDREKVNDVQFMSFQSLKCYSPTLLFLLIPWTFDFDS